MTVDPGHGTDGTGTGGTDGTGAPEDAEHAGLPLPRPTLGRVEIQLAELMRRAERTSAAGRSRARWHALERSGYLLLHELDQRGPVGINALAEAQGLDASTVTRQVLALEKAGLVRRERDPEDGRAVIVTPTPEGRAAHAAQRELRADMYADILAGWDREDVDLLADLLERLNAELDAYRRHA